MTPEFAAAAGGMTRIPQWFVWRLDWNGAEGKFDKVPWVQGVGAIAARDPKWWMAYEQAVAARASYSETATERYVLGFWMTADCGYWFLDIDMRKCGLKPYESTAFADGLLAAYPGAFVEWSSGLKGLHIIGRGTPLANHRCKPEQAVAARLKPLDLEFYTQERGIAFGLDGVAWGCADAQFDLTALHEQYFPARPENEHGDGPRPDWRGPADDALLLERALAARVSAGAAFGGKASFAQLWRGECEHNSEHDMALAAHLAFWTGCDEARIERMMLTSGLVREKWNERRGSVTYLQYTIANACAGTSNVYQEPERNPMPRQQLYAVQDAATIGADRVSQAMWDRVEELMDMVTACGSELDMHNVVMPAIYETPIPSMLQSRVENEVKNKLWSFGNRTPLSKLRAALFPPVARGTTTGDMPAWASCYAFCTASDSFFNLNNGTHMSMLGFQATYGRLMPMTDQGRRENAAEQCLHFWGMPIVEQIGYRPDCGPFYEWQGIRHANLYSPSSLPELATGYTNEGVAGIDAFQKHLFDMCGRRQDVYLQLLYWMAHNVQHPGVKIRWSPLVKGVHGDGKTLITSVLRSAMGFRNVSTTSNSNISNSGGFTDWAVRGAVNIIEEIMLTGKIRHQLYNAMKEFISNNIVDVNRKGAVPYQAYNTTNHWANTNHNDALPLEPTDRRWFVLFTPWASLDDMMAYCGLDAAGWKARTDTIDHAKNHCAGELRKWFLDIAIPEGFDINGSAPVTPEKLRMRATSTDSVEAIAEALIAQGAVGITRNVLSSSHLSRLLQAHAMANGTESPKTTALNHMLTRMGYSRLPSYIKWEGVTITVWLKDGCNYSNDEIRSLLDGTRQVGG